MFYIIRENNEYYITESADNCEVVGAFKTIDEACAAMVRLYQLEGR